MVRVQLRRLGETDPTPTWLDGSVLAVPAELFSEVDQGQGGIVACAGKPAASVRAAAPRSARYYGSGGARRPGRCWECGAGPTANADGECGYC